MHVITTTCLCKDERGSKIFNTHLLLLGSSIAFRFQTLEIQIQTIFARTACLFAMTGSFLETYT